MEVGHSVNFSVEDAWKLAEELDALLDVLSATKTAQRGYEARQGYLSTPKMTKELVRYLRSIAASTYG